MTQISRKDCFGVSCRYADLHLSYLLPWSFPFPLSCAKRESFREFVMCPLEFGGPSDSQGRNLKAAARGRAKYQQGSPDCHNSAMAGQGGLDKGLMEGLVVLILKGIHPKRTAWSGDVTGQRGEPPYGQSEEAMLKRCQGNFRKAVSSRDPLKCPPGGRASHCASAA